MRSSLKNRLRSHHLNAIYAPSRIRAPATATLPMRSRCCSSSSICELNRMPATKAAPTQSAAERVLKKINRSQPMRNAPAIGGAMVDKPGTNFAMIKELTPQRSKRVCV